MSAQLTDEFTEGAARIDEVCQWRFRRGRCWLFGRSVVHRLRRLHRWETERI